MGRQRHLARGELRRERPVLDADHFHAIGIGPRAASEEHEHDRSDPDLDQLPHGFESVCGARRSRCNDVPASLRAVGARIRKLNSRRSDSSVYGSGRAMTLR